MDRRDFLKILGITSSTALISSCGVDKANEKIIPYVIPPEEEVYPGKALYLNTTCSECPANCGMQVRINEKVYHDVRSLFPTKLEGIEGHPINDGALCARGQAGLFRLYHTDRIKRPMMHDESGNLRAATWKEAFDRIRSFLQQSENDGRSNLYFSSRTTGSLSDLLDTFSRRMKVERLPEFEVYAYNNLRAANNIVFGKKEIPRYLIEKSDFLLTFGADLFETFLSPVNFAVQYSRAIQNKDFNWFHLEPHLSLTGVQANHRHSIIPGREPVILAFLLHSIIKQNAQHNDLPISILRAIPNLTEQEVISRTGLSLQVIRQITDTLIGSQAPLIIAGGVSHTQESGLETAVLTALIQYALSMTENTVDFSATANYRNVGSLLDVESWMNRLDGDEIGVLFLSRTDPANLLPADYAFQDRMKKARLTVGMSDTLNNTMKACDVILPLTHSLEAWGDATPYDGLFSIYQPALEPQYDSLTEGDILLSLMNQSGLPTQTYKDFLLNRWQNKFGEDKTRDIIQQGFYQEKTSQVPVRLSFNSVNTFLDKASFPEGIVTPVLVFTPSIRSFDGRSKDIPLLTEIPEPLTTISYGNWISVPRENAREMGLSDHDEVQIAFDEGFIKLPVKIQPLLARDVFMVQRDIVRMSKSKIDGRSGESYWFSHNIKITKTGNRLAIPILSGSMNEEGRGILPPDEHNQEHDHDGEQERWYPEHEHKDYRWGMAIDLESCIGCNACVAACYVENNIPIVGEKEHLRGREMSWIRLEPFVEKETIEFIPMLCQQCDNAPCEPVCPVYASYHNPEGLNVQVYNRCVGTRYCSNNCPYKVRRFNWFDHVLPEPLDKMYNPDLSVRGRGIMEKCTFCIQRIRAAKDHAKDENRLVTDGEITPACAQTCPTNAITFGNLKDENSKVYQLAHSDRAYRVLEELGTEPAVNYLRKKEGKHEA